MDVRIGGVYERMLLDLAEHHHEPTATGMIRILIRDAAAKSGLWPTPGFGPQPESESLERETPAAVEEAELVK